MPDGTVVSAAKRAGPLRSPRGRGGAGRPSPSKIAGVGDEQLRRPGGPPAKSPLRQPASLAISSPAAASQLFSPVSK